MDETEWVDPTPEQYGNSMHWPYCRNHSCTGCLPPLELVTHGSSSSYRVMDRSGSWVGPRTHERRAAYAKRKARLGTPEAANATVLAVRSTTRQQQIDRAERQRGGSGVMSPMTYGARLQRYRYDGKPITKRQARQLLRMVFRNGEMPRELRGRS